MVTIPRHAIHGVLALAMLACVAGCGGNPVSPSQTPTSPQGPAAGALPLGAAFASDVSCPSGSRAGTQCRRLTVSCPSLSTTSALLRVSPPSTTRAGTIVLPSGGSGTGLQGDVGLSSQMITAYAADGLATVEVAWQDPGIWGAPQARTFACRFATAARWIYDNLHSGVRLFALQGTSGASSQIAFALAHYGLGDVVTLANLGSGPLNCPLCPLDARAPEPLLPGPPPSVNRDPQLNYPWTPVRVFLGQEESSPDIIADANAYFAAVTSAKSMTTVPGTGHHLEDTQNGINAYIQSVRSALR